MNAVRQPDLMPGSAELPDAVDPLATGSTLGYAPQRWAQSASNGRAPNAAQVVISADADFDDMNGSDYLFG